MAQLKDTSITGDCSITGALLHNGANYFNDTGWIRLWESSSDPDSVILGRSRGGVAVIYGNCYGQLSLPAGKTIKICTLPDQLIPDWCSNGTDIPHEGLCTTGTPRGAHSGALQIVVDSKEKYIGIYNPGNATTYWGFMLNYFTKI